MRGEKIVSLDAIGKNYELIKSAARGVEIIGVLKADAYGHGGKKSRNISV